MKFLIMIFIVSGLYGFYSFGYVNDQHSILKQEVSVLEKRLSDIEKTTDEELCLKNDDWCNKIPVEELRVFGQKYEIKFWHNSKTGDPAIWVSKYGKDLEGGYFEPNRVLDLSEIKIDILEVRKNKYIIVKVTPKGAA